MHHLVLDHWSQRSSVLHARDPRAKVVAILAFLIAVATTSPFAAAAAGYFGIILVGVLLARIPLTGLLARACVVLPFSGTFALISYLTGDSVRAVEVLLRSYASALAVLLLVATTPLPSLLTGLERMGAPGSVVFVLQLVYRYIFVISEQAQHMLQAARCRGGRALGSTPVRAAAGMVAVLFGKSYQRAETLHRAMLARGLKQKPALLRNPSFTAGDAGFLIVAAGAIAAVLLTSNLLA